MGDVPTLRVDTSGLTGKGAYVDVNEVTKGWSPLGGTFVISYGADYTDDIDFDASNETVKAALEALASIDQVIHFSIHNFRFSFIFTLLFSNKHSTYFIAQLLYFS